MQISNALISFYLFYYLIQMADDKNDASEFVLKLQDMIETYNHIVDWNQDQTEIVVKDLKKATDELLPRYFRHRKFESFVRQLNMYNFYKVCRQKNNTISFKNDIFYKGNENNFCKIKRKKKTDFKNKPSEILEQNLAFIYNHSGLDSTTKEILSDILNLKNAAMHSNKKLESLFQKLVPEMKAAKFRRHDPTISSLKSSVHSLKAKEDEIEEMLSKIKNAHLNEVTVPDCEKVNLADFEYYQRSFDMALSQTNICSTIIEHCQEKRFETKSNLVNNNFSVGVQTFLSITHFIGANDVSHPAAALPGQQEGKIISHLSRMSIQDQIQNH